MRLCVCRRIDKFFPDQTRARSFLASLFMSAPVALCPTLREAIRTARRRGGDCYLGKYANGWRVSPAHYVNARSSLYVPPDGRVLRLETVDLGRKPRWRLAGHFPRAL